MQISSQIDCKSTLQKIGENIEYFRLTKKKSIKEMAAALSLSVTGYRNIERGLTDISVTKIFIIGKVLNICPAQILLLGHDLESVPAAKNEPALNKNNIEEVYKFVQEHKTEISFLSKLLEKK